MKPSGVSVDQLLREASSSGAFDSQGVFTIAGEAAIGKLASFQLPRKSAWILKVVQCAVAWGASAIEAKQTNDATYVGFAANGPFDVDGLQKALLDVDHDSERYLQHLACGLRAVGFGDKRPFSVQVYHLETLDTYRWDGRELSREKSSVPKVAACTVHLSVNFPEEDRGRRLGGLLRAAGRASEEYLELVERGEACPIPLKVDGRRLDTLTAPRRKNDASVADLCLSWPGREPAQPSLRVPQGVRLEGSRMPFSDRFTDPGPLLIDGDLSSPEGPLLLKLAYHYKVISYGSKNRSFEFKTYPQFSEVHWVSDGVVCQTQSLRWDSGPVTLDMYLPADGLPTDLSGLTFRDIADEEQTRRLSRALVHLAPCLERLVAVLRDHRALPFGFHAALYGGMGLVAGVVMPGFGKVVGTAFAGLGLAGSAKDKNSIVENCIISTQRLGRVSMHYRAQLASKRKRPARPSLAKDVAET